MKQAPASPGALRIIQNCWVVPDLHRAAEKWLAVGVGPFLTMDMDFREVIHRGKPVPLAISVALAQAGDVQIELIVQRSEGPSAYRDVVPAGESGFHHVCREFGRYDETVAELTGQGVELAMQVGRKDSRFCYADTRPLIGCMLEIVEPSPASHTMMRMVAEAAAEWDGRSDPIRPHPLVR